MAWKKGFFKSWFFIICYVAEKTSDKLGFLATCIYPLSVVQVWHAKEGSTLVGSFCEKFPLCCQGHFAHTRSPQNRCGEVVNAYFFPLEGWWAFYIVCWWILGSSKVKHFFGDLQRHIPQSTQTLANVFCKLPQQTGHVAFPKRQVLSSLILGTNLGFAKLLLNSKRKL